MRAGKILIALSGRVKGYRSDIDSIHALIAEARELAARGEARPKDKLRAALWLMRRAIQRDDPVTLTPSEARALLALAEPQEKI